MKCRPASQPRISQTSLAEYLNALEQLNVALEAFEKVERNLVREVRLGMEIEAGSLRARFEHGRLVVERKGEG